MKEPTKTSLGVTREKGLHLLHQMLLIRRFEEKAAEMYTRTNIRGFLHLYIGEEAVAAGVMQALTDDDYVLATYREHGHALARGVDPGVIMAEMYGKQEGCSRGRGGSMHLFEGKKIYGGNAIVAGHLSMAVGMALASKKQKKNGARSGPQRDRVYRQPAENEKRKNPAALAESAGTGLAGRRPLHAGAGLKFNRGRTFRKLSTFGKLVLRIKKT